jgi:hypothetical protein
LPSFPDYTGYVGEAAKEPGADIGRHPQEGSGRTRALETTARKEVMSVKAMLAKLLEIELAARGVNSLAPSDCEEIVERLIEQLTDFELSLAAKEINNRS